MSSTSEAEQQPADPERLQTHTEFSFTVHAPLEKAAPLFGAWEERKWAPGWEPRFLHPQPPRDQQGSLFIVHHDAGQGRSVWTTTVFDLPAGHVQYVYVRNNELVTRIDIRLTGTSADRTLVTVVYERTALSADANSLVARLAQEDGTFAGEWEQQINGYLGRMSGLQS